MESQKPLTNVQKELIYKTIFNAMLPDDRYPHEVIADEPYNGDEEKYLNVMAGWHGIKLG
jgi:hypothetical protein